MKLATIKGNDLDGDLIIVSKDNKQAVKATDIVPNLRLAMENWAKFEPQLLAKFDMLNSGNCEGTFAVNCNELESCMPRCFQFADGSAFIQHIVLVRKARNAALPETLKTVPLIYQGISDRFMTPTEDIPQIDPAHGTDFEAEVGVIVDKVPMGTSAEDALKFIRLFVIINDVSLRGLIPDELKAGFGFFQGKPNSSLSPFAITADELGEAWKDGRIHLPMRVDFNGDNFGRANAGEMHFHFGQIIAHAARTRELSPGTVIGSGTVANVDLSNGSSCLAEKRMVEKIETGEITTPFMKVGDNVKIEMLAADGKNLFGTIEQNVIQA